MRWVILLVLIVFLLAWKWAEEDGEDMEALRWKPSAVSPLLLPVILLVAGVFTGITAGWTGLESWLTGVCVDYTLLLSVYDVLLWLLLPLLRRYFQARTCALLWILPNFLYVTEYTWLKRPVPKLVVHLPERVLLCLLAVWLMGALGVFLWKTVQHICFRRQILRGSYPVSAQNVLKMWTDMQIQAGYKRAKYRLYVAPSTKTPLTVGIWRRTTRVLLPEKDYSEAELRLILRHELIHIRREDLLTKLYYVFTKSIGWFHPLVWLSMRRSADDLELSCDEAVLLGEDEATRRQYAELLLRTAGDERGLTSCLSANARALKHRLTGAMVPGKKRHGWWLIGLCIFALLAGKGLVAVSYGETTAGELLGGNVTVKSAALYQGEYREYGDFLPDAALADGRLLEAIAGLRTERLGGNYSIPNEGRQLVVVTEIDGRLGGLTITDRGLTIQRTLGDSDAEVWYLPQGADAVFAMCGE